MSSINNKNPPLPPGTLSTGQAEEFAKNAAANPATTRPPSKVEQQQAERVIEQAPAKKSAAENERLMAQSGFQRVGKRRGRGFDLDDAAQVPIPLPVDEVDETAWEQRTLDDAQEELTLQGAQLKQLAQEIAEGGVDDAGLVGKLMGHTFTPTQEGLERLQGLGDQAAPEAVALAGVSQSLKQHFGLHMDDVPTGPAMLAAALVVAGLGDAVLPQTDGELAPKELCQGMQKLVESSNNAVQDARGMSDGINKQIALHRTFMFKR